MIEVLDAPAPEVLTVPTDALRQEVAQEAFALEVSVDAAITKGKEALWELAEALYHFNDIQGWLALGHDKLGDWLAERGMSRRNYDRYWQTYQKLAIGLGVETGRLRELELTKVDVVLPSITAGKVALNVALNDVEALGKRDLMEKYYGPKPEVEHPQDVVIDADPIEEPDEPDEDTLAQQHRANFPDPEDYQLAILNDASQLPWGDLRNCYAAGVPQPRIRRETVAAFLRWQEKYAV